MFPMHSHTLAVVAATAALLGGAAIASAEDYNATEIKGTQLSTEWQEGGGVVTRGPDGKVVFLFGEVQPSVVCSPLQVCDIELEPGEIVRDVLVGDTVRWKVEPATSGLPGAQAMHLIVKPAEAGLTTSMVVTTSKRTYHIELKSHDTRYMARVGFEYPEDVDARFAEINARVEASIMPGRGAGRPARFWLSHDGRRGVETDPDLFGWPQDLHPVPRLTSWSGRSSPLRHVGRREPHRQLPTQRNDDGRRFLCRPGCSGVRRWQQAAQDHHSARRLTMAILNRLRDGVAIAGLSLILAACQTLGGSGLIASTVTAELTPAGASSIASDMVAQLGTHVGPGGTTIRLRGDDLPFGSALEASLRTAGYGVVTDQASAGAVSIDLAYAVDAFEGSVMVRLSTVSLDLTRLYKLEGEVAVPTGPTSVMRRDEVGPT